LPTPIRLFQNALPADPELTDLNEFLASQRVAGVHRETIVTSSRPIVPLAVLCHARRDRKRTFITTTG
jgi:hypothetical protein